MPEEVVLHKTAEPIKVKLEKGQKGTYAWEITVQGDNKEAILAEVDVIDQKLRNRYISKEESNG